MSEAFIRRLAGLVVRHQAFTSAVETAVVEVLTTTLRDELAGQTLRLYIPKTGNEARGRRVREIRALWNGKNTSLLAAKYGLTERRIQQIVQGRNPAKSGD